LAENALTHEAAKKLTGLVLKNMRPAFLWREFQIHDRWFSLQFQFKVAARCTSICAAKSPASFSVTKAMLRFLEYTYSSLGPVLHVISWYMSLQRVFGAHRLHGHEAPHLPADIAAHQQVS
jgi:hypothetical protein